MPSILPTVAVGFCVSMFMAWSIGANSNSSPFAPAVGANAIPVHRAALFVGIFASLGAVAQGSSISRTVGRGLIRGTELSPVAATAALLTAAAFIAVGVRKGYPIPAAFTVTGSVIGVGLALGGELATAKYLQIGAIWLTIPFMGASIAFATAYLLRRDDVPESLSMALLGGIVITVMTLAELSFLPGGGSLAGYVVHTSAPEEIGSIGVPTLLVGFLSGAAGFLVLRRYLSNSGNDGVRNFLIAMGAVVAFSSGGSQVGLATGPLESTIRAEFGVTGLYMLVAGGTGILVGSWTGSPRLIQAVSREYSSLGPRRSIAALIPSFLIAQLAIGLGVPISFNEVIISSIVGSGFVEGSTGVSGRKIGNTVGTWAFSILAACGSGAALYTVLELL